MIAKSIQDVARSAHPSVVYGLYGKWGEGKTSLLNFVEEELQKSGDGDNITIAHFNPWIVGNEEALLKEFFQTIMVYPDENVRKFFKQYGSLAIFASKTIVNAILSGVGTGLAAGLEGAKDALSDSEPTISQYKNKVSSAIKKSGKHLLVVIDDIDRLDKDEIHAVLRLIRQVADFENVIYLVAMDVDMVSKAIAQYFGGGAEFDGRKYIDKIVQVPITIPPVPKKDFEQLVNEDLTVVLKQYTSKEEITQISETVSPLMHTRRELLRFTNQLSFVLPSLRNEVNVFDLCVLEAIKSVSAEAYRSIYHNRAALFHESNDVKSLIDKDKEAKEAQERYEQALENTISSVEDFRKHDLKEAIDGLFTWKHPFDQQKDIDDKRIYTTIYFAKYFTQLVPSGVIADTELDAYLLILKDNSADDVSKWIKDKNDQYGFDEVQRALTYLVQHQVSKEDRRATASKLSISISVSSLGENVPYHIEAPESMTSFVAINLLQKYFTEQDPDYAGLKVMDCSLLNETLNSIFDRAELNFSMNLLSSVNSFYTPRKYDCKTPILILAERFKAEPIKEQMRRSKYLLQVLYNNWKSVDEKSFETYADSLIGSEDISIATILEHFINGTDDANDINSFVYLFENQVELVLERVGKLSVEEKSKQAIRVFCANYRIALENMKVRRGDV